MIKKMNVLDSQEINQFINYVDPENKQYLNFNEFTKKIKSNMGNTDDLGNQTTIPYNFPFKE